jgi:hypothetical protein
MGETEESGEATERVEVGIMGEREEDEMIGGDVERQIVEVGVLGGSDRQGEEEGGRADSVLDDGERVGG